MPTPRVVIITPSVPHEDIPHAGGRYVAALVAFLEPRCDLTVIAPSTPVTRSAVTLPGAPKRVVLVGGSAGRTPAERLRGRLLAIADRWGRRLDPGMPSVWLMRELRRGGSVARVVRDADAVDLQWSEQVRLAGMVRRVAPRARVLGTFHDVTSQSLGRVDATHPAATVLRSLRTRWTRGVERRDVARLDEALVFSRKDAELLGAGPNVRVVHPPLAPPKGTEHPGVAGPPTVLLVAHLARAVNDEAARWFLADGWPLVRSEVPEARLRIVGAGRSDALARAVALTPGAELVGFVPDLGVEYARAWCSIVPLRRGAGVKFKTVEALVHGVPVVTTGVGAEGIGHAGWYAAVSDDAQDLARGVVEVLTDVDGALQKAGRVQVLACREYGADAFAVAIGAAYGW